MIDAAATQAATRSPFHTARPGVPRPSTAKPSVSTYVGATSSRSSAIRSAITLATCIPSTSHSPGSRPTTDQATALRVISAYSRSRCRAVSSLESLRPAICRALASLRMTAAATNGPAHAPRPASSAPATGSSPTRRRARS